jgi:hypothetical protein
MSEQNININTNKREGREGGWVKTGEGDKMEFVPGPGEWVKTGEGDRMKWVPNKLTRKQKNEAKQDLDSMLCDWD